MARWLACLALVVLAAPVAACINDIELPSHEREFRSRYRGPSSTPSAPSTDSFTPSQQVLLGAGAVLLVGAGALTLSGGRREK